MQAPDTLNNMNKLSPREKEVAVHILEGMSTSLIAKKLGLKSNTVSTTKNRIFMKLGVDSNVGLYKMLMG
jgi:DNA-binding CsgD family transcriptional regulator